MITKTQFAALVLNEPAHRYAINVSEFEVERLLCEQEFFRFVRRPRGQGRTVHKRDRPRISVSYALAVRSGSTWALHQLGQVVLLPDAK